MRIGIDISQLAYPGTGVANFVKNLVENLISTDQQNEYVLFYSSLRKEFDPTIFDISQKSVNPNVVIKTFHLPPVLLDFLWNRLHILSIEKLIGPIDVFLSSDWTQPPSKAKKVTILYDLIIYKYPEETAKKIVAVQKRKLQWVQKEVDSIICISEATKKDAIDILHIPADKLHVVYPGM